MSFPIRRYLADPSGQQVPEVPQILRRVSIAAGESHGLGREVGGPRRPLLGASLEACLRFQTFVNGLGLEGIFGKQEAVVRTTAAGPDRLAYAGHGSGENMEHWWIGGDLDRAFRTSPKVITLLVGAEILRGRRRPVARTSKSTIPLEKLTSERFLGSLNEPIESIGFRSEDNLLGVRESLWLLAGSVAKLIRALPDDGPVVRLLFRFPAEEHWLTLLPALYQGPVSPELCTTLFERTRRDRGLFEAWFTNNLEKILGDHRHRVQVVTYDALHDVGSRLEAAVDRGEKPTVASLLVGLREMDELWKFVLHPRNQKAIRSELDAERRFALEELPRLDGFAGLVNAADVVDLLKYGSDGLAIVVDEASAARRMLGLAERFARRHPDGAARMAAIGPLGKILGGTPGPHGPFAAFRGEHSHMVVLDPDEPSEGEWVPTGDLFRELYFVR